MFFFKKKELHLDIFTQFDELEALYPVDYTYKFYPSWWKKLPVEFEEPGKFWPTSTIRRCTGFLEYYKNSVALPLWCDLACNVTSNYTNWNFSDKRFDAITHPVGQMTGYLDPSKYFHLKLSSPWHFKCKEEVNFMWSSPTWNMDNPADYFVPPAVINYKYNSSTNVNLFFMAGAQEKKFIIPAGRPMAFMHPLTERTLKIHRYVVSPAEMNKITNLGYTSTFTNKYNRMKSILKLKEQEQRTCPFKFRKD